ncbi:MAG: GDP-mannose 4,6-dehydratase [Candidatus Peribacteraceae bacterium]|nr:GDP-mannose 4,6-dehydratase [Candidatus Peribacteraceae bacterium]MDD5741922.1 GDP-mannose 4,6-dehydratase [Candidatus Peribacteraceae bacterium]
MTRVLITGIAGQDGSYLAERLCAQGYDVHGIVRPESLADLGHSPNLEHVRKKITLHGTSLDDRDAIAALIASLKPDQCYHLASPTLVTSAFMRELSQLTTAVNSVHHFLSALCTSAPSCRFFFAGSSEMFGHAPAEPQNESTPFNPRSIYGIAKLAGHHLVVNFRREYGLFACTGILYNHESPRRSPQFVTRKVTMAAARISLGLEKEVRLGNIEALRDWGYAPEYVHAMQLMAEAPEPRDHVISTGVARPVRALLEQAFGAVGLDYRKYLVTDPSLFRPQEAVTLRGDSSALRSRLGWKPVKPFGEIIDEMVQHDLKLARVH